MHETELNEHFWKVIHRIQLVLGMPDSEVCEVLALHSSQLFHLRKCNLSPPASGAVQLAKRLNIGFDELFTGQIDYHALVLQHQGVSSAIPERYLQGALSRRSVALGVLDFIEQQFGWQKRALTLQRFQMTEKALAAPQEMISVKFVSDVGHHIFRQSRDSQLLSSMGRHVMWTHRKAPFVAGLRTLGSPRELFEKMVTEVIGLHFEKNFDWSLSELGPSSCQIKCRPRPDAIDAVGEEVLKSQVLCSIRMGALSAFPWFAGFPSARVEETNCIAHGGASCDYTLHFGSGAGGAEPRSRSVKRSASTSNPGHSDSKPNSGNFTLLLRSGTEE
ncbi:MAG: hypothetical protein H7222_18170 [Methylotenera sp.]|nr:hypothetical protein [Oligoflexia bacterium]